jgi:hypothetical protein
MPPAAQGVQSPNDAAGPGLKFAQDLLALHQARQNSAMSEMDKNLKAAEAGFPVDSMHIAKLAKKAGIHIDTSPEAISAFISEKTGNTKAGHPQQPGRDPTAGGNTLQPPPGTGQPSPGQQGQQGQPGQQQQMSKKDAQKAIATHWADTAIQAAQKRGDDAAKLGQLHAQVTQLKLDVVNGTPEQQRIASGKLMALNEIPFSIQQAEWNDADPQHRQAMIDVASGHESDAEFKNRSTQIMNTMLASGRYRDPGAAQIAADAIAKGMPVPAEALAKQQPFTMTELTQQAAQVNDLVQAGVPPESLQRTMQAAAVGGLANALPTGMNPPMLQQLNVQKEQLKVEQQRAATEGRQVNIEAQRAQAEQTRAEADAARVDVAAKLEENKEFFSNFQAIVAMEKARKGSVPTEVMDSYVAQLAERSGLDVTESRSWLNYLTLGHMGGMSMTMTPKPASGVVQKMTGSTPNAPDGSKNQQGVGTGISKFYKGVKGALSSERTD